jgi:hypothetical protein
LGRFSVSRTNYRCYGGTPYGAEHAFCGWPLQRQACCACISYLIDQPEKASFACLNFPQAAFPKDNYCPPGGYKLTRVPLITGDILVEFVLPTLRIGRRRGGKPASFMSMPKTTMNKDNRSPL